MYWPTPGQSKCAMPSKIGNRIFIGLGSNLDDAPGNLAKAIQFLQEHFQTQMITSSLYFSEPVEVINQPWFYNQVAYFEGQSETTPTMILKELKAIEQHMGRQPSYRYGPRLIDLDLLFFKNWVFESQFLTIPHPKIAERLFVLDPLRELTPSLIHPRFNLSVEQMIAANFAQFSRCEKISN
jgi:2-amino-4-hydroxy-6-hydroxymethyldihydropteridine diphosphokinase